MMNMGRKFNKLEERIKREYVVKGVSPKTAEMWAKATAGKVYREQERERG